MLSCVRLCGLVDYSSSGSSVEFSGQEYWSGFTFPPPGDVPDSGIEPESLASPALTGRFFTASAKTLSI